MENELYCTFTEVIYSWKSLLCVIPDFKVENMRKGKGMNIY